MGTILSSKPPFGSGRFSNAHTAVFRLEIKDNNKKDGEQSDWNGEREPSGPVPIPALGPAECSRSEPVGRTLGRTALTRQCPGWMQNTTEMKPCPPCLYTGRVWFLYAVRFDGYMMGSHFTTRDGGADKILDYADRPSFCLYSSGLSPPRDILIRFSRYQTI